MIVKNEAADLQSCLETVGFADEIVILDSGSSDDTVKIAKQCGARVAVNAEWPGFGPQRQRAQALAKSRWVLMLDADERVTPDLAKEICQVIEQDPVQHVFRLKRLSRCFGHYIRHGGWYPDEVVRLYPRASVGYGNQLVHESVQVPQDYKEVTLNADLLHLTYQHLPEYLAKSAQYSEAWSDQCFAKGKRAGLGQAFLHGLGCFLKMYLFRAGFLDGRHGLLLATLSAHSTFCKYVSLWLREQNRETTGVN